MEKTFKAEVKDLLNLVIHSLYSNRDIFLRELISNASDALDKAKFTALSDKAVNAPGGQWQIRLAADEARKTLTISDNGIGMSLDEVEENIGTIAKSGTKAFASMLKAQGAAAAPELIGQFGVGFYSAFIVASRVELRTRKHGTPASAATLWSSSGEGSYAVESCVKDQPGTEITLFLKDDAAEYLEEWKIRKIVKQYSDFIAHPVVMAVEKYDDSVEVKDGEEPPKKIEDDTLNSMKAIWTRSKSEVKDEEYAEFYKHISHDFLEPLETIAYKAEGALEFQSLLFLPSRAPFDLFQTGDKKGVQLYVKRVFIMDDCKALMPEYLRFVKGVVDSADLPLNVSREILQEDKILGKIQKNLVKKVLDTLGSMLTSDREKYLKFWKEFGRVLKEGMHSDFANKEKIQDLLLWESTSATADKPTTLKEYLERLPEGQSEIYYVSGPDRDACANSPILEGFKKKGWEVLYFAEPIDEWVAQSLTEYAGKPVKNITKGDVKLDEAAAEETKKATAESKDVLDAVRKALDAEVKEVRFTNRLAESPACLVADEHAMSANMERIYRSMNQNMPVSKRILELNREHAVVKSLLGLAAKDSSSEAFRERAEMLLDQALLAEGSPLKDPARFAKRVARLMEAQAN
ncbi:MAG: hypothetical protein RL095_2518 [Verrucomicrobiota bacterium]|jgi:molecular chaperone HtpG